MKLEFEMLESNDGHYAKRAPVPGGFIYLFTDWDDERGQARTTACCFVPNETHIEITHTPVRLSADDLHALRGSK